MTSISGTEPAAGGSRGRPPRARPFADVPAASYPAVTGLDEVGRGALCGPVVVAAIWFDPADFPAELLARLDDSKRVPAAERALLAPLIRRHAACALAAGSARAVDRDNVRAATLDAMARAVRRLGLPAPVRVDGRDVPPGLADLPCEAVVRGDSLVPQIAAASIVAKVVRDGLMRRLDGRYPAYGWSRNVGYGTAAHGAALRCLGATRHHRLSFLKGLESPTEARGRPAPSEPDGL